MAPLWIFDDLPLRLDWRGTFLHGTEPLHPRVAELFAKNIFVTGNATYEIRLGHNRAPLLVHDVAYLARRCAVDLSAAHPLRLWISDGTEELVREAKLGLGADDAFFVRLKRHGCDVPCRLLPAAHNELLAHAEVIETVGPAPGPGCLRLGRFELMLELADLRPQGDAQA